MARELLPLTNNQNNFQDIAVIAIVAVSALLSVIAIASVIAVIAIVAVSAIVSVIAIASFIDIHLGSYPENFDSGPVRQAYSLQGPNFDSNFDSYYSEKD